MSNATVGDLMAQGGRLESVTVRVVKQANGNKMMECPVCGKCMDKFLLVVEGTPTCRDCLVSGQVRDAAGRFIREVLREALNDRGLI